MSKIYNSTYEEVEKIGEGAFSKVFATIKLNTKEIFYSIALSAKLRGE